MKKTQDGRLQEVLEKVRRKKLTADEIKAYDNVKVVDLFNATVAGASAQLKVMTNLYATVQNLPHDAPEDLIKFEAMQLEEIMRTTLNGICECLLAVLPCKDEDEIEEAC